MATSQAYDWNELANLFGDDTFNALRTLCNLIASYPTATTTATITVTGGVGTLDTTAAIIGEISVISIQCPTGAAFKWYLNGKGTGGNAIPLIGDTTHDATQPANETMRSPFVVNDILTFGIKEATIDTGVGAAYKVHFTYKQGVRAS